MMTEEEQMEAPVGVPEGSLKENGMETVVVSFSKVNGNCTVSNNNGHSLEAPGASEQQAGGDSRSPSPCPSTASSSHVSAAVLSSPCSKCQKLEAESQAIVTQLRSQFETEFSKLKKEVELANRAKEATVMRYANSEMEVMKLKRDIENTNKQVKELHREVELLNKKQHMLSTERERLTLMVDSKVQDILGLQKQIDSLNEEISSRDFKIKWTQNKLASETEAHSISKQKLEDKISELEKEIEAARPPKFRIADDSMDEIVAYQKNQSDSATFDVASSNDEPCSIQDESSKESNDTSISSTTCKELEMLKTKNRTLIEENNTLSFRVQTSEQERLVAEEKIARLQESNSEHLHQIASLQSDLAATESLKFQLKRGSDAILALQNECQSLGKAHADSLSDMAICRAKEAELLGYTQQVTEKNVALQSEFSSVQAKSFVLEEENERLQRQIEQLETDIKNIEKMMTEETKNYVEEKQAIESEVLQQKRQIVELQQQLDESRGEIGLLHKKLNSSVREFSKELTVARKQVKTEMATADALSQSSRTSSNSSLANCDPAGPSKSKSDVPSGDKPNDQDCPVIPDQQILIERIVKLQRTLAKKQDKIEFLQEHVKQLVESLQKKSKIIQCYAMEQDIEALASNLSEQNKAEALRHGGIMASVYGSKPADDGLTLDLSLEINRKLQVVLEDTLLKNITLKDSLNTLGKEISSLMQANENLRKQTSPESATSRS